MTMVMDRDFPAPWTNDVDDAPHLGADAALRRLAARGDERLLGDAGLTAAEVLGPEEEFRRDWAPHRAMWSL